MINEPPISAPAKSRRTMWPFLTMSLQSASLWGDIANWTLIACLIGGVLATVGIVQTSNVKESHWEVLRMAAEQHISELENETARAKEHTAELQKETAALRKDVAEADAKAATAQLNLEKFKAPRTLTGAQLARILGSTPSLQPRRSSW
jgi:septal ring factor EnvC (AmiA/AmiB activator)